MNTKKNKAKKTTRRIIVGLVVLIVILLIAKRAGWLGKDIDYRVTVEEVSLRTLTEYVTANGKIRPETEVKISPDVSGEIVELHVKEGDFVQRGDFLIKIKPDIYESALERAIAAKNSANANLSSAKARLQQAQAQFDQIELSYNRNKKLFEQKVISESEYETVFSSYRSALADVKAAEENVNSAKFAVLSSEATVREATENLRKTSVFAPMDGTVSMLNVEIGERVVGTEMMAGTEMMRIANLNSMEVIVDVNENDIIKVKINDSVDIEVDAYLNRKFQGIVTEIANSAKVTGLSTDQAASFEVKIRILPESYREIMEEENRQPFRPGMSASVDIITKTETDIPSVSLSAVTTRESNKDDVQGSRTSGNDIVEVIFIYENGKVYQRNVKTGIQDSYFIHVTEGVETGEKVVIAPYNLISTTLKDGMTVNKVSREELFAPGR